MPSKNDHDPGTTLSVRDAEAADLPRIVELLADDPLGAKRERVEVPVHQAYASAFAAISQDPNNELVVACSDERVVGVLQLTFIPGISRLGAWRCQIEGVRVDREHRSAGVGGQLLTWAVARAKQRGCSIVQLTTDKLRPAALKFYERHGFSASHEGLKLTISEAPA